MGGGGNITGPPFKFLVEKTANFFFKICPFFSLGKSGKNNRRLPLVETVFSNIFFFEKSCCQNRLGFFKCPFKPQNVPPPPPPPFLNSKMPPPHKIQTSFLFFLSLRKKYVGGEIPAPQTCPPPFKKKKKAP